MHARKTLSRYTRLNGSRISCTSWTPSRKQKLGAKVRSLPRRLFHSTDQQDQTPVSGDSESEELTSQAVQISSKQSTGLSWTFAVTYKLNASFFGIRWGPYTWPNTSAIEDHARENPPLGVNNLQPPSKRSRSRAAIGSAEEEGLHQDRRDQ